MVAQFAQRCSLDVLDCLFRGVRYTVQAHIGSSLIKGMSGACITYRRALKPCASYDRASVYCLVHHGDTSMLVMRDMLASLMDWRTIRPGPGWRPETYQVAVLVVAPWVLSALPKTASGCQLIAPVTW